MFTIGRKESTGSRLLPAAIATPVAAGGGVLLGWALFGRRTGQARSMNGKRVEQAMSRNPSSVAPSDPVREAAQLMRSEDVGSLPVVDGGRLVGIVTDRDIAVRVVADARDAQATTVGEIASGDLVTVRPEQELDEALRLMAKHQVRRLPVVQQDRLVGIVAQADVALEGRDQPTGDVVQSVSQPNPDARA